MQIFWVHNNLYSTAGWKKAPFPGHKLSGEQLFGKRATTTEKKNTTRIESGKTGTNEVNKDLVTITKIAGLHDRKKVNETLFLTSKLFVVSLNCKTSTKLDNSTWNETPTRTLAETNCLNPLTFDEPSVMR